MRRPRVALELLQHRVAERALGQHAFDRLLEHAPGKTRLHLREARRADAAGVAAMPVVELVLGLVAGDLDLVDVGHDDEVAGVDVGRVDRLVLAPEPRRDLGCETPQNLVRRVDDEPLALDVGGAGGERFHGRYECLYEYWPEAGRLRSKALYFTILR